MSVRSRQFHRHWATRSCARRGGYLLLEIVLSIALLLMGMTYIGTQMQKSQESSRRGDDLTRVLMLAETKMAELDTGLVSVDEEADEEVEGDFTLRFPNYGWRFRIQETATEGLWAIALDILYARRESLDDEFDVDNAKVVYSVHTLRAEPAVLDVEVDLGLDEEMIFELADKLPPGVFDPPFLPPNAFRDLDFETLIELLPQIIAMFGDGAAPLLATLPPDMRAMLELGSGKGETEGDTQRAPLELSDDDLNMFNRTREEFDRDRGAQPQPPSGNQRSGARGGRK